MPRTKLPPEVKARAVSLTLHPFTLLLLDKMAEREGLTRSAFVDKALKAYFANSPRQGEPGHVEPKSKLRAR